MRGLPRILNQFPKSVLEKKVLTALLDETKDRELLSLVLQNVFKIVTAMPTGTGKRVFTDKVIPRLRETFLVTSGAKGAAPERDSLKEAGLMVLLENMPTVAENSSGKEFKDGMYIIGTLLEKDANASRHTPNHTSCPRIPHTFPSRCIVKDASCNPTNSRLLDYQGRTVPSDRECFQQD
jgi:SCY1-like protein 2